MSNERVLVLGLDYDLKDDERRQPPENPGEESKELVPYRAVTRNLINHAFTTNHQKGMDSNTAKQWRGIRRQIEKAVDDKADYIYISDTDFQRIYDEIYKCSFVPQMAFLAPVLYDELDKIKNRSLDEDERLKAQHLLTAGDEQKTDQIIKEVTSGK